MTYHDDCLEKLKTFEANHFDALVTDPPAGIGFMGKEWDKNRGGRESWINWMSTVMQECLRVMKPGAHGLVWAIPRTSHWTGTALELAGFEVRDVVTHLFGSGFPKSLDISKAIDKAAGVEREIIGRYKSPEGTSGNSDGSGSNFGIGGLNPITAPSTPEAKQWEGFGTALKPACEFWFLVRKPLSESTVAKNVLKWGTGGLNIDAGRISTENAPITKGGCTKVGGIFGNGNVVTKPEGHAQGRFPANLILNETAAEMLDAQSGVQKSGGGHQGKKQTENNVLGKGLGFSENTQVLASEGGASRFFYVAKASKREKGEGNTHPTVKPIKLMEYLIKLITPLNGIVLDPFMGSGSTGVAAKRLGFQFIGIEKELPYLEIAKRRITLAEIQNSLLIKKENDMTETLTSSFGIKETKEALIGLNEVGVLLAQRFSDGVGVDDFVAFYDKLKNDTDFKSKLNAAWDMHQAIPDEIKNIDLGEAIELAVVEVSYIPKYVAALHG